MIASQSSSRRSLFLALVFAIALSACAKKKGSTPEEEPTPPHPEPTPVPLVTTDVTALVAVGPSLSFNNLTGGVNSTSLNPVTKRPAIAYYDKNSTAAGATALGALKYASMDATGAWTIEVVDANYGTAACGTANSFCVGAPNAATGSVAQILSLTHKSDGSPALAYVYGASLNTAGGTKQLRVAERDPATGRWSVSIPFQLATATLATNVAIAATVDPIKGVALRFDENDRAHLTYTVYTQTLTNSRVKYSSRALGGDWATSDITAAVTGSGTITALAQGNNQAGMEICPGAGPVLVTRVVDGAAGVGKPLYIRCTTLSGGQCTAWSVLNLTTGCSGSCFSSGLTNTSNAGLRTDLVLEPGTKRPVIGVYSTATPANTLYTVRAPQACQDAQPTAAGSWGAPVAVGTASQGLNGFALAASSTETLIAYLNSTTSVMVNRCTTASCSYLATGSTVETVTVAGEGTSAVYDADSDTFYASYARLPAAAAGAVGNDIVVAAGAPASIVLSGSLPFQISYVDTLSDLFPVAAAPTLSAARTPDGHVGFAYFYQDSTAADMKLYYGIRGGTAATPRFSSRFVISHQESAAGQFVGGHPSLAFDSSKNPVIAYYNGVVRSVNVLRSTTGGVTFTSTTIDDHASNDYGQFPRVAVSGSTLGISYYDATNSALKFARSNGSGRWDVFTVDGFTATGSCGNDALDAGRYSSLAWTSTGRPVIVYQADNYLRIASAAEATTSATYTWTCLTLDASGNTRGAGTDLALTAADHPHIVSLDATDGQIRYLTCASDIASCLATPTLFTASIVDAVGAAPVGKSSPSIAVNTTGTVFIAYHSASYQALALATKAADASAWTKEYLDEAPSGTSFPSSGGQFPALLLNDDGLPMVFFRSWENWLRYFSREVL